QSLRAVLSASGGRPVIRELAVRPDGGTWAVLATNLVPEFEIVSGRRRISEQQLDAMRSLKMNLTPDLLDREAWNAFWDAPLDVPGRPGTNLGLPRQPGEIRRAKAVFHTTSCAVKTDGARLEVTFPGLAMGIFAGQLRFTVYRGSNLLRQEAVAKTEKPMVAYKYDAG